MYRDVFGHVFNKDLVTYVRSLNTSILIYTRFPSRKHPPINIHSPQTLPYSYTQAFEPTSTHKQHTYVVYTPLSANSNPRVHDISLQIRNSYHTCPNKLFTQVRGCIALPYSYVYSHAHVITFPPVHEHTTPAPPPPPNSCIHLLP